LKFFSFAAAVLATGWCVANLKHFDFEIVDDHGMWIGGGLGALLRSMPFGHRLMLEKLVAAAR